MDGVFKFRKSVFDEEFQPYLYESLERLHASIRESSTTTRTRTRDERATLMNQHCNTVELPTMDIGAIINL